MGDLVKFEYKGVQVRSSKDDFLNLTDMWKACGSDPNKRPVDWIRREGAPFIEFIGENLKVAGSHFDIIRTDRGGKSPGTWAHWQIGLAYAKYLSHEFHAHCNKVVRDHIDGRGQPQEPPLWLERVIRTLPANREAQWEQAFTESVAKLLRQPSRNSMGGAPVWLRSVTRRLSKMRFGIDLYSKFKALAQESGSPYYDHMGDDVIPALKELQLAFVAAASRNSSYDAALADFQGFCDFINGLGAQLALFDRRCKCGSKLDPGARFCSRCGKKIPV